MHGTNRGPLIDGTRATGRTIALYGASFTQYEGDKIRSTSTESATSDQEKHLEGYFRGL
jgi:hypothetical protein